MSEQCTYRCQKCLEGNMTLEEAKYHHCRPNDKAGPPDGTIEPGLGDTYWLREEVNRLTAENKGLEAALREAKEEVERIWEVLDSPDLLERLAALEHERWSGWMDYQAKMIDQVHRVTAERFPDRWARQARTPYNQLSESERESDRDEVRKTLDVIRAAHVENAVLPRRSREDDR